MKNTLRAKMHKIGQILADRLPVVGIIGLIMLYYIQLSHMA